MQRDFVKVIPNASCGLFEDARSLIELVDYSFDAWRFSQQGLFIDNARIRIDHRRSRLSVDRRGHSNEAADHHRAKDKTCARQQSHRFANDKKKRACCLFCDHTAIPW